MSHDLTKLRRAAKLFLLSLVVMSGCFSTGYSEEDGAFPRSTIVETNSISDVLKYAKPNTLVLFDLDNTLIEPHQTLGSDQWFCWRIKYYEKQGYEPAQAVDMALMDWMPAVCLTQVKVVESNA